MKAFKKFAPVIAAVLGVVAIVMLFLPAVTFKAAIGDETISYKGWETIFGLSETNKTIVGTTTTEYLKFSFMNLLPLILTAAGIVLCLLSFFGKGNKFFAFIATVCFIVAAGFFFLALTFTVAGSAYTLNDTFAQEKVKEGWKLGVGPILAAILSILAAVCAIVPTFLKNKTKKRKK